MLDGYIPFGQAVITKEEYLANKEYYDNSGFLNVLGTEGISTGVTGGFENYEKLKSYIESLISNTNIKYRLGSGNNGNPFSTDNKVLIDNPHFVTWFIKNSGFVETMSYDDANSGIDSLLYTNLLDEVNPLKSSSDDYYSKMGYINNAVLGDVLFFDTFQRNGSVGIYISSGKILLVDENNNRVYNMWVDNEDGTVDYTYWMDRFNGTIKRIPSLNKEDYIWHAKIMD